MIKKHLLLLILTTLCASTANAYDFNYFANLLYEVRKSEEDLKNAMKTGDAPQSKDYAILESAVSSLKQLVTYIEQTPEIERITPLVILARLCGSPKALAMAKKYTECGVTNSELNDAKEMSNLSTDPAGRCQQFYDFVETLQPQK
jgi:hypothetical protein